MLNRHVMMTSALVLACGAAAAIGAPEQGLRSDRIAIGVPAEMTPPSSGKGGYVAGGINCATATRFQQAMLRFAQETGLRSNINQGDAFQEPWDIQINGDNLENGNRWFEPNSLWIDDPTDFVNPLPGQATPNTYGGTTVLVPYRIVKESWFDDPMDPDVIPPIDTSDPPFPGFPFEGMEVSDEAEAIVIEAMDIIEAVCNITFVETDPSEQQSTFPRGTPILLIATGAAAELPFGSDDFLDGDGASFSISLGMLTGPLVLIQPGNNVAGANLAASPAAVAYYNFQLLDEEEIPTDDMGNFIALPGWNPADFPNIPAGRLPMLDHDDIDQDGVAADLGDDDNPGVMYTDWEPRPFLDRRQASIVEVIDHAGIDDFDANDNPGFFDGFSDDDGHPSGTDVLEGIEMSPFTNLVILHPNVADNPVAQRSVIIHELMHAIGFAHEHQRNDRDDYVEILEENIAPAQLGQFTKAAAGNEFGDYDFESIMHYGRFAFSGNGGQTIRVVEEFRPRYETVIGNAVTLSRGDAAGLRQLYGAPNCPEDLDGDNDVDIDDWFLFIQLFINNDILADVNLDGIVDINDFISFINAFSGRTCFSPPPQPPVDPSFEPITDPF